MAMERWQSENTDSPGATASSQAGQKLGGLMDDATFLAQCGIEIDARWLMEFMQQEIPAEIQNYTRSLMRITDILSLVQFPANKSSE
jgi:hypothetical protein